VLGALGVAEIILVVLTLAVVFAFIAGAVVVGMRIGNKGRRT
jgi:hypothetical protein